MKQNQSNSTVDPGSNRFLSYSTIISVYEVKNPKISISGGYLEGYFDISSLSTILIRGKN